MEHYANTLLRLEDLLFYTQVFCLQSAYSLQTETKIIQMD